MLIKVLVVLYYILNIYWNIMTIGVILSWIPGVFKYRFPRLIRKVSDWYLYPFRGLLVFGFLDFTPIIGFLLYSGVLSLLLRTINILSGI